MRGENASEKPTAAPSIDAEKYDDQGRWFIESVVFGDGSTDESGHNIQNGIIYASAQAICGRENLHRIEWDDELFAGAFNSGCHLRTYFVGDSRKPGPPCVIPPKSNTRNAAGVPRQTIIAKRVLQFIRKFPGLVVILHQVGARGPSPLLSSLYVNDSTQIYAKSTEFSCVPAALINGVYALKGEYGGKIARKFFSQNKEQFLNLKSLGLIVNQMSSKDMRLQIRRMCNWEHQKIHDSNPLTAFEWLSKLSSGIWIARIKQDGVVDHAICIDASKTPGVILDSEEEQPILLNKVSLTLCGGKGASRLRVAEVRELLCIK